MLFLHLIALCQPLCVLEFRLLLVHLFKLYCFDLLTEPIVPFEEGKLATLGCLLVQTLGVQGQDLLAVLVGQLEREEAHAEELLFFVSDGAAALAQHLLLHDQAL